MGRPGFATSSVHHEVDPNASRVKNKKEHRYFNDDKSELKLTSIFKAATIIELMLHLSHVKLTIHPTDELILYIQITRGRVDFNGYSATTRDRDKPQEVLPGMGFQTCHPPTHNFV